MKSLKIIGKDVLKKIFPKRDEFHFKSTIKFYDHTLDIHRSIENIYSNFFEDFHKKHLGLKPNVVSLNFKVWGMELGRVDIPLLVMAPSFMSDDKSAKMELVSLIRKCNRIKQTLFPPTHLIVTITVLIDKWEILHHEVYYLEKWQSDEIVTGLRK